MVLEANKMNHGHTCSYSENKINLLRRLRRIEGQIKGIQRMIEDEKYCADILVQIAAVRAALNKVGLIIFEDHTKGCVAEAIQNDNGDKKVHELIDVLSKFIR